MNKSKFVSEKFDSIYYGKLAPGYKTDKTKKTYYAVVCSVCEFCECDFFILEAGKVQEYFDSISKLSPKTISFRLGILRSIAGFMAENANELGISPYVNPFISTKTAGYDTYLKQTDIPSVKQIDKLLCACEDDPQLFLIVSIFIRCGLTMADMTSLKKTMVGEDLNGRVFFKFTNKFGTRYVKVPDDVAPLLRNHSVVHPMGYLFLNADSKPLGRRTIESLLAGASKKAGLKKTITARDLRNFSIAYMLKGHASADSVSEYVDVEGTWIFRYNQVLDQLDGAPCDYSHIRII